MSSMVIARNILLIIVVCCVFISLGAFTGKRLNLEKLFKYTGITALLALVGGVIYIAVILFSNPEAVNTVKNALLVIGIVVGCCICLALGGFSGKKIEVFRVIISCGIIVLLSIIVFLIYLTYLSFFA